MRLKNWLERLGWCAFAGGLGLLGLWSLLGTLPVGAVSLPLAASTTLTGTVTLWHAYYPGSSEDTALQQVMTNTLNAHPGLVLSATYLPFDQIFTQYQTAVQNGSGPDLLLVPNDSLGQMVRTGQVLTLDGYLQGRLTNVYLSAIEGMKVDGHSYGVASSAQGVALYYNTTYLSVPPTTTTALLATVQSGQRLLQHQNAYHLFGWFRAFGGLLLDGAGRCIADRGGFAAAMQYLLDLQTAGAEFSPDYAVVDGAFRSGNAAMTINGPWALADYEMDLGANLGVVPLPTGPLNVAQPMLGLYGFYVNPHTPQPALVVEVVLQLTNPAAAQIFADVGEQVLVRSDVTATNPHLQAFAQAAANSFPRPQSVQFGNYWGPFGDMVTQVLTGTVTPNAGVQQACATMNVANGIAPYDRFMFLPLLQR